MILQNRMQRNRKTLTKLWNAIFRIPRQKKEKKKKHRGSIRISRKIAKRHNPCFDEAHRKKIRHEDERRFREPL